LSDLSRRLASVRAERDRLAKQLNDLQAVVGLIDPAYSEALRDHAELAQATVRRERSGVTSSPSSRPPDYEARAYDDLRRQRVWQRGQAVKLRQRLRQLVDNDTDPPDDAERARAVHTNKISQTA
jgi:hypothetical protein